MHWRITERGPRRAVLELEGYTLILEVFPLGGTYCLLRWGGFLADLPVGSA